jgi:small subunit ribosomal protein S11
MSVNTSSKSKKKVVPVAIVSVHSTFNNTIVSITDLHGGVISASSGGAVGFKNSRKSTAYAGQMAAEKALEEAIVRFGIKTLSIRLKGPGASHESVVRSVGVIAQRHQVAVTTIRNVSAVPHNGCRPSKRRRV